jgi:hypothetical protein
MMYCHLLQLGSSMPQSTVVLTAQSPLGLCDVPVMAGLEPLIVVQTEAQPLAITPAAVMQLVEQSTNVLKFKGSNPAATSTP